MVGEAAQLEINLANHLDAEIAVEVRELPPNQSTYVPPSLRVPVGNNQAVYIEPVYTQESVTPPSSSQHNRSRSSSQHTYLRL